MRDEEREKHRQLKEKNYNQIKSELTERKQKELAPDLKQYWDEIDVADLENEDLDIYHKLQTGTVGLENELNPWRMRIREEFNKNKEDKKQQSRLSFSEYIANEYVRVELKRQLEKQ